MQNHNKLKFSFYHFKLIILFFKKKSNVLPLYYNYLGG